MYKPLTLNEKMARKIKLSSKELGEEGAKGYQHVELPDGTRRRLTSAELESPSLLPMGTRVFMAGDMTSQSGGESTSFPVDFEGRTFKLSKNYWKTNREGMERLQHAERLFAVGNSLRYIRFLDETPMRPLTNVWTDTGIAGYSDPKVFAVQTNTKVVERCILMTTDPSDLVFDPTCVRKGTRMLTPLNPPVNGGTFATPSPLTGRAGVGEVTLRIDTKLLKEAESAVEGETRQQVAERLRKTVDTVGKTEWEWDFVVCREPAKLPAILVEVMARAG